MEPRSVPDADAGSTDCRRRFEAVFRRIHLQRMADVPILNPALAVEAVGFERRDGARIGVLVTPWFMNLVCVPDAECASPGETRARSFACGTIEFLGAREEELGGFEACSLFSPMFEFATHADAVAVASEVLKGIHQPATEPEATLPPAGPGSPLVRAIDRPLDRRGFLRAAFDPEGIVSGRR